MNKYPWLQDNINQWQQLINNNKAPHAVLLSGAKGLAKIELANEMAHIALCENLIETGACNECKGCQLFAANNHTDLTRISAEKAVIKVEQIRKLSRDIILTSARNHYRVVIIENAEQMNAASANALLKTLEEPPPKVIIILTTSEIDYLLATIKSRCFKINSSEPPQQVTMDWLSTVSSKSQNQIDFALALSNGAPLIAENILENNIGEIVNNMLMDLNQLYNHQKTVLEISKIWITDEKYDYLKFVAAYLLGLLKSRYSICLDQTMAGFSHVNFDDCKNFEVKLLKFINHIYTFMSQKEKALKTELLLDELLIGFQNEFNANQ